MSDAEEKVVHHLGDNPDAVDYDSVAGRAIFYNGDYRDVEVDISFRVDRKEDILQKYTPIYKDSNSTEVVGVKFEKVICFVYVKQYLY